MAKHLHLVQIFVPSLCDKSYFNGEAFIMVKQKTLHRVQIIQNTLKIF